MDDALPVRSLQRVGNLARDADRLVRGKPALCNALSERRALDQLEHQGRRAIGVFQAVNDGDIGMVQRSQDLRLALKASQTLRVVRKVRRQDFERDLPPELGIAGAIDLAHKPRRPEARQLRRARSGGLSGT